MQIHQRPWRPETNQHLPPEHQRLVDAEASARGVEHGLAVGVDGEEPQSIEQRPEPAAERRVERGGWVLPRMVQDRAIQIALRSGEDVVVDVFVAVVAAPWKVARQRAQIHGESSEPGQRPGVGQLVAERLEKKSAYGADCHRQDHQD